MSFVVPLLFCLGVGGSFQLALRRRFEEALPAGLLFSGLAVYGAGLLNHMAWGVWLAAACAAAFPAALLYLFCRDRRRFHAALSSFITPGLVLFLLLYIAVFVLDYRRGLGWWDEYSHWAPMAKETCRIDQFYCAPASALSVHRDYPPFVTLFQYLWCKLCGGYDEPLLYRALHTLSFSFFLPAVRGFRFSAKAKGWGLAVCALAAGAILVSSNLVIIEGAFLTSLLTDGFLGLILAYCLGTVLLDDGRSFSSLICLCLGLTAMVLTKKTAIYFVGLCAALYLAIALWERRQRPGAAFRAEPLPRILLRAVAAVVVPAVFYLSWQAVLAKCGESTNSLALGSQLAALPGVLMDAKGDLSQRLTVINFRNALFSQGLGTAPVDLTFLQLLVFFTGVYAVFARAGREDGIAARITWFAVFALLGGLGYAFLIMLSYLYFFDPYEAVDLFSYGRYMGTYGLAMLAAAVMLFFRQAALWNAASSRRAAFQLSLLLCGLVLCVPSALGGGFQPALVDYSLSRDYLGDVAAIDSQTEATDRVLVVAQGDKGLAGYVLQYELLPQTVGFVSLGQPKYDGDVWTKNLSAEAFSQLLDGYDILYVYKADDDLTALYPTFFPPESAVGDGQLYRIDHDSGHALQQIM